MILESQERSNKSNRKNFKNDFIFKCYESKNFFDCSKDYYEHESQKHSRALCECCNFSIDLDIYNFHTQITTLLKIEHKIVSIELEQINL
jgi:hypothetical protein